MITLTIMRKVLMKCQQRIINYRFYKHFSDEAYKETSINYLSQKNLANYEDGMPFQEIFNMRGKMHA